MVIESYLPPNKTDDAECFFRTESDIKQSQQRQLKLHRTKSLGRPFECSSKVLSMIPSHIPHALWITESGFLARLIQFPDIAKSESESGKKPVVLKTLRGHQGPVTCIQWFWLDGRVKIATGSWDKTIRIWDYESGECEKVIKDAHADFIKCLAVTAYTSETPSKYSPTATATTTTATHTRRTVLFSGSSDKTIRVWDVVSGTCLDKLEGHRRAVESLSVSLDGCTLFSASSDTTIRKFDLMAGAVADSEVLQVHETSVFQTWFNAEEEELWSASADKTVKRYNTYSKQVDAHFTHPEWTRCFTHYNSFLITGCRDEHVRLFDLNSTTTSHTHTPTTTSTGTTGGSVNVPVRVIEGHCDEVSAVVVLGDILYSGSYDCTVRQWDLRALLRGSCSRDGSLASSSSLFVADGPGVKKEARQSVAVTMGLTAEEERELAELME